MIFMASSNMILLKNFLGQQNESIGTLCPEIVFIRCKCTFLVLPN